jgi:ribonuclease D
VRSVSHKEADKQPEAPAFPVEVITSRESLVRLAGRLAAEPLIAVDLEADSLHHYQEKVCLLQIATPHETVLVDPLALSALTPLVPVMADPAIRKVMHGADYDIRSLFRDFGIEVANLFDTMIACQFLGEPAVGLAAVLKKRFDAELDKRYQKADWSRRPLSPEMVAYAVQDTALLIELYRQLFAELETRGRLSWVEEESELVSRVRAVSRAQEPLFLRFKGAARMVPRSLAVLEELLHFRDERARHADVPPFKILGTETVRELAEKRPLRLDDLAGIQGLTPRLVAKFGKGIITAIARGCTLATEDLPRYPVTSREKRDTRCEERLKRLKRWRETMALTLGIDAGIVANNNLLEILAETAPEDMTGLEAVQAIKHWQWLEFGAELVELLRQGR